MKPLPLIPPSRIVWRLALLLWLGALIANPIGVWMWGEAAFPALASLGVVAQFLAVIAALTPAQPLPRLAAVSLAIALLTWTAELVGSQSGFPFGSYHYTPRLQPQIAGVPLLIPFAWAMMLLPSWAVASRLLTRFSPGPAHRSPALHALLTGLVFTAWDLYLDPFMVSRSIWVWDQPGAYFGIPWINFTGWWLTAVCAVLLVRLLVPAFEPGESARPRLIIIYALTWLFQALGSGLFWNQPGPALAGFLGMGAFALPAVWDLLRAAHRLNPPREPVTFAGEER